MKFSVSWLKEYLEFDATLEELCEKLTSIGLEVEEFVDESAALSVFEVAEIVEAIKHENSNKLNICKVKSGDGNLHQIVCGAKNARAGIKVAMAPIGAVIPGNGMVIKKAKIAGVESFGMLCSASELGIEGDDSGIIEIDQAIELGAKISNVFDKNDAIVEINITPNRGDCLGIYGIAKDLSAAGFGKLKEFSVDKINADFSSDFSAKIEAEDDCKVALFREVKNVKNQESPDWLKKRLESVGQNSISAIVDITNYVMICLNRPMHAYDKSKISGNFNIRYGAEGEKFHSLKDEKYELSDDILVVADEKEAVGVAGVIGSLGSSCDENSSNIILEAAFFDKVAVANSGRKLNILSDARYRFERGVDYKTCEAGIELASKLIKEICGGEFSDVKVVKSGKFSEKLNIIEFDFNKFEKLIGVKVEKNKALAILQDLGFGVKDSSDLISVEVPSSRTDIEGEADLIEEIIRIYGYDNILPQKIEIDVQKPQNFILDNVRYDLAAKGLTENINWSFCDEKIAADFAEVKDELKILNPISENLGYMRPNLIIGLLNSYQKNYSRGFVDGEFFEVGKVFEGLAPESQKNMIAAIFAGKNKEQDHYGDQRDFDIFDAKKAAFDVFSLFGLQEKSVQIYDEGAPKYYHPHRSAVLKLGKNIIGYFGEIHPKNVKNFDLKANICAFEIFVDALPQKNVNSSSKKSYEVTNLQAIWRDFAFLMDESQKIGDLTKTIENCDKKLIKKVDIFDIYQGENIENGKKSVALRVMIQPLEKMTSEEVEVLSAKIIEAVRVKGCELR